MKNLMVISIVFAIFMLNSCTQKVATKIEKPNESTFEVYSIHEIEIKPNVDLIEFETFVMKELTPIYNKMKGQKMILVKGDRGLRTNKYALILTFESIEDRDRIYPPSGGFVGDFGAPSIWEKFGSMTTVGLGAAHTDYIKIAH